MTWSNLSNNIHTLTHTRTLTHTERAIVWAGGRPVIPATLRPALLLRAPAVSCACDGLLHQIVGLPRALQGARDDDFVLVLDNF